MTEKQFGSDTPISRNIASGYETQYGFPEGDIVPSEVEGPVISSCPG